MSRFLKILAPCAGGAAIVLGAAYILADQFVAEVPAPFRGHVVPAAVAQTAAPAGPAAEPAPVRAAASQGEAMPAHAALALGRPATGDEIAAWDIDIRADGQGLPEGSGDVLAGEEIFTERCAVCHGDFGEAVGRWPQLAGGHGTLTADRPVKTIGSFWPYLSTVWDYVHRAMPFGDAQSLRDDEVYAIVAYLLYLNDLVEEDFELSRETFLSVEMPNAPNFHDDDRTTTEVPAFSAEVCMVNCKEAVEITMRAAVLDVTPEETRARQLREAVVAAKTGVAPRVAAGDVPAEPLVAEAAPAAEDAAAPEAADPALVAAGEAVFRKCRACHEVGEGARNRSGPDLTGVVGRTAGTAEGFKYSAAMAEAGAGGLVWYDATLSEFLGKPKAFLKGTKMSFAGLSSADDIAAVVAYLGSFAP